MKEKLITAEELKSLLLARYRMDQEKNVRLQTRLQQELGQELGNEAQKEGPEVVAINNKLADWLCDIVAQRLKQNCHDVPLLSTQDLVKFVPAILEVLEQGENSKLDDVERKRFEKTMEIVFNNYLEMVFSLVPAEKNIYEEYWRWIEIVLKLAAERNVPPTELFNLEDTADEITRQMLSKEQFIAISKKAVDKFVNADTLKKTLFQPTLDALADGDEQERQELEQEFEKEIMPQLREIAEKSNKIIKIFFDEETARIYTIT
ncbi:MAG: hypothetical protein PHT40_03065 [Patescibacteria group bacterium]|nr:hypothetical protein [Patescibacteria group bacterium]